MMTEPKSRPTQIVLATAPHGLGHYKATQALARALRNRFPGVVVKIVDVYAYRSPFGRILTAAWEFASLTPGVAALYRRAYRFVTFGSVIANAIQRFFDRGAPAYVAQHALSEQDRFVALHPSAVGFGARAKRLSGCQLHVVATDFVLHAVHCNTAVDRYFVPPNARLVGTQARRASQRGQVCTVGIPIARQFQVPARVRDGMTNGSCRVLVSFGGRGYGARRNIELLRTTIHTTSDEVWFTIVTGRNRRLRGALVRMVSELGVKARRVRIVGYVKEMADLMRQSDIVVGKAGGITISEACALGKPVAIIDNLPGQEDYNCKVVVERGVGVRIYSAGALAQFLDSTLVVGTLAPFKFAAAELGRPAAADDIADQLIAFPHTAPGRRFERADQSPPVYPPVQTSQRSEAVSSGGQYQSTVAAN